VDKLKGERMKGRLRRLVLVGLAVLVAGSLSGSAAASLSRRVGASIPLLRVGCLGQVSTLDTYKGGGGCASTLIDLGVENLMRAGPNGTVEPWLAQSTTTPAANVLVYHLRHGVRFWDGSELTSADVVNSMNYARSPKFYGKTVYEAIKTIRATDRYTVTVTFKHPDPTWGSYSTNWTWIFEKKFQDGHKATMGNPGVLMVGTGPWRFDSLDPTSGAELSANPDYWGGKVKIAHISFRFFADETSLALAFRSDGLDSYLDVKNTTGFKAAAGSHVDLVSSPGGAFNFIGFNSRLAPWSDVHVRRAIAYAINKPQLIKVSGTPATPAPTFITPESLRLIAPPAEVANLLRSVATYPYSLAKAKAELAKSAYPTGFSATVDSENTSFGNYLDLTQAIAGQLSKIGIKLTVRGVTDAVWSDEAFGKQDNPKGLIVASAGIGTDPSVDPHYFLTSKFIPPAGANFANYDNPAVDALITAGEAAAGHNPKRFAIYTKMLKIITADEPYIPLFRQKVTVALAHKFIWTNPAATIGYYGYYGSAPWALSIRPR
jgi:peptide/nickel transport system substrate-binding protein